MQVVAAHEKLKDGSVRPIYECECGRTLYSEKSLRSHMKKKHGRDRHIEGWSWDGDRRMFVRKKTAIPLTVYMASA